MYLGFVVLCFTILLRKFDKGGYFSLKGNFTLMQASLSRCCLYDLSLFRISVGVEDMIENLTWDILVQGRILRSFGYVQFLRGCGAFGCIVMLAFFIIDFFLQLSCGNELSFWLLYEVGS